MGILQGVFMTTASATLKPHRPVDHSWIDAPVAQIESLSTSYAQTPVGAAVNQ
jgi:hypothetical protein